MKSLLRVLFVLATLGLAQLAFAEGEVSRNVGSIPTAMTKLSAPEIKDIASEVLIKRGWLLKEKTDDKVVAYLKQRSHEAEVTLTITKDSIELTCWGFEIHKKTGERKNPAINPRWIDFLKGDITHRMNQAASKKL